MTKIFITPDSQASANLVAAEVTTLSQVTSSLAQYASVDLNFTTSKTGILASFTADRSCLIRVYSTNAARSADSRAYNVVVPAAGVAGLIAEVEIDTTVINNVVTNVVYANGDSPQAGVLYLKVFNLGAAGVINLSLGVARFSSKATNTETISATKQLTLSDVYYQDLNPSVSSVIVKLPAVTSTDNAEFEISNTGGGANAIVLQESDSTAVITLSSGTTDKVRAVYIRWSGVTWIGRELSYYG